LISLLRQAGRTLALQPPAVAHPSLVADPGLIFT
jgi:hypothetical protein